MIDPDASDEEKIKYYKSMASRNEVYDDIFNLRKGTDMSLGEIIKTVMKIDPGPEMREGTPENLAEQENTKEYLK